jgi:hypothetical protein
VAVTDIEATARGRAVQIAILETEVSAALTIEVRAIADFRSAPDIITALVACMSIEISAGRGAAESATIEAQAGAGHTLQQRSITSFSRGPGNAIRSEKTITTVIIAAVAGNTVA